ncbi:MAG TPA: hypothetical protein VI248_25220 [Kineosporiaceae bacterium]
MGYEIHGLIGRNEPVAHAAAELGVLPVALPQGFAFLPGTVPDVDAGDPLPTDEQPLWWLTLDLEWAAISASRIGPIAYVEAEFAHGLGSQAAIVWSDGQIALGPLHEDDEQAASRRVPLGQWPVNRALRHLSVQSGTCPDEFEALRLGRHRDTDSWRESATSTR